MNSVDHEEKLNAQSNDVCKNEKKTVQGSVESEDDDTKEANASVRAISITSDTQADTRKNFNREIVSEDADQGKRRVKLSRYRRRKPLAKRKNKVKTQIQNEGKALANEKSNSNPGSSDGNDNDFDEDNDDNENVFEIGNGKEGGDDGDGYDDDDDDEEDDCHNIQLKRNMEVVEKSPQGRYVRFNQLLGVGSFKKVYRAWDSKQGIEVAWNKVRIMPNNMAQTKRTLQELTILQQLDHPNIMHFFASWLNKESMTLCFITEIITSGTLKDFIRSRPVTLRILKRWCRHILSAIDYLHSHDPPIMHRDLKCENIFINGATGDIRIGDLGLASWERGGEAQSCLGTPEYMAPELYEEKYDEQVDIYSFGMCVLEMVSKETPYMECTSAPQIFHRVTQGILPNSFQRLKECPLKDFIFWCIGKPEKGKKRPTAKELLESDFLFKKQKQPLQNEEERVSVDVLTFLKSDDEIAAEEEKENSSLSDSQPQVAATATTSGKAIKKDLTSDKMSLETAKTVRDENISSHNEPNPQQLTDSSRSRGLSSSGSVKSNSTPLQRQSSCDKIAKTPAPVSNYVCNVLKYTPPQLSEIFMELVTPSNQSVKFSYYESDTPVIIAMEMVKEGIVPSSDFSILQNLLERTLNLLRIESLKDKRIPLNRVKSDDFDRSRREAIARELVDEVHKVEKELQSQATNMSVSRNPQLRAHSCGDRDQVKMQQLGGNFVE